MRKKGPLWSIGPAVGHKLFHLALALVALGGIAVALVYLGVFYPFHDKDVLVVGFGVAGVALAIGGVAAFVYYRTPRLTVDTARRVILVGKERIPFALAGPIAIWRRVLTYSDPHGGTTTYKTWEATLVCGTKAAREELVRRRDRRRDADPFREVDEEPISLSLDETRLVRLTAGCGDIDHLRLVCSDLVALWNNQSINVKGAKHPDLAGARLALKPSTRDLEAL